MILYKEAAALKTQIEKIRQSGKKIGFVPTMGALHKGHLSLIKLSQQQCDITICSIFVNPAQFNDPKDFEKYPATINNDILLLENARCDILFYPAVAEIYPEGISSSYHYDLGEIENLLEGKYRPGHFQGVCRVMHRLLNIVNPDKLFIGQKDYQQCLVIKRLAQLIDCTVEIIVGETLREATGLAMSSRNLRLNEEEKKKAAGISKMLGYMKTNFLTTPIKQLEKHAADYLLTAGFNKIDYVSIADAATLQPAEDSSKSKPLVTLIAAFIGEVRLIDNIFLGE